MYKIYCDMDGVLVGFAKRFKKLFGKHPDKVAREVLFTNIIRNSEAFWVDMPWEKGGKELWKLIKPYKPTILSSPTNDPKDLFCKPAKREWVETNLGLGVPLILEQNKYYYADPKAILIDDTKSKIDKWVQYGGIGILHIDYKKTINELQALLENEKNKKIRFNLIAALKHMT